MLGTITNFIVDTRSNGDDSTSGPMAPQESPPPAPDDGMYVPDDRLIQRFIEQLDERELTADQREVLRRRLGGQVPNSVDAQLRHLHSKLARFEAYSDSLESFIDENGTGREVLNELRSEMSALAEDLDELTARVDAIECGHRTLRDDIDDLRASQNQLTESFDELAGRQGREIAGVDAKVHWVEEELQEELDEIRTDVSDLKTFRRGFLKAVRPQLSGEVRE